MWWKYFESMTSPVGHVPLQLWHSGNWVGDRK